MLGVHRASHADSLALRLSEEEARISYQKDLAYRRWAASVGGVYVDDTKVTPNPYLTVPNRDLQLPGDRGLTLVNPAYMTRLVHSSEGELYGTKTRLTSLSPVNPVNVADSWERKALVALQNGGPDFSEVVVDADGKPIFRFMGAFRVERSCLKCHASQGYKEGDLRGGLSLRFPLESSWRVQFDELARVDLRNLLVLWGLMSVGIFVGMGLYARRDHRARRGEEKQRRELQLILEHMNDGFTVRELIPASEGRAADFRYIMVNQAYATLLGRSRPEIEGRSATELGLSIPPDHLERYARVVQTGVSDVFEYHSAKSKLYLLVRAFRVDGARYATLVSDLSAIKEATLSLEKDEALLSAIFEHAPVMMLLLDSSCRVIRGNNALATFGGHPEAEMVHKAPGYVISCVNAGDGTQCSTTPKCQDCVLRRALHDAVEHGRETALSEGVFKISKGDFKGNVVLMFSVKPLLLGGQRMALVCLQDVTEARKLEAQLFRAQRLDNLGLLASGVAHDLNNVLMPILMGADFLQEVVPPQGEPIDIVRLMKSSAQRGASLVRQLLLFGRGGDMQRRITRPEVLVIEIENLIRETFPKNVVFEVRDPGGVWALSCDPTQMHQVLLNLCVNARDAMPKGGRIELTVSNEEVSKEKAAHYFKASAGFYVCFRIRDYGQGIAPEIIEKIFDPFFTTKPQGKGTGLGLSTVMGIVHSHKGFVTVQSTLGQGSDFAVYIPIAGSDSDTAGDIAQEEHLGGRGEFVLVVDDEEPIRKLLRVGLAAANYKIVEATDGAQALSLYSDHKDKIAVVVCDMMMPNMDGRAAIECLRMIRSDLPVVAMSGVEKPGGAGKPGLPSDVVFVQKPFELSVLLRALRDCLRKSP